MADYVIRLVDGVTARDPSTHVQPDGTATLGVDLFQRGSDNQPGSVSGVAPGASASVALYTPSVLWQLEGFIVSGNGDATVRLSIGGTEFYGTEVSRFQAGQVLHLPRPHRVNASTLIALEVTASAANVASADYFGTILGRAV